MSSAIRHNSHILYKTWGLPKSWNTRNVYLNMNAHIHGTFQLLGYEHFAALYKAPARFRKPRNASIRQQNHSASLYKAPEWFRKPRNAYISLQNCSAGRGIVQSPGMVQKTEERLYKAAESSRCII